MQVHSRDCIDLPVTCSCDEALQWYNKSLAAFVTLLESPLPLVTKACELDHNMPLAHCLAGIVQMLFNFKQPSDPQVAPYIEAVKSVDDSIISEREKDHLRAFLTYASGNLSQATEEWISILVDYPLDLLALIAVHRGCIYLGHYQKQRDTMARVLPHWNEEMTLYPFIITLYAFSLEENNQRDRAEELVRKALSMETKVPWAYHALSHVIEEERDPEEGVDFLTSSRNEWCDSLLGPHVGWHLTLYYLDLGKTDEALQEYDTLLIQRVNEESVFGLTDATSFLWRLSLMGVDPGEGRWERVVDCCTKWLGNHSSAYFDTHIMMSLAHGKVSESAARMTLAKQMIKSVEAHAQTNSAMNTGPGVAAKLGVPVCNALLAFGQGKYDEVLSTFLPLRYDFASFGNSWAQRQIFSVTLIEAAVRAKQIPLALALVAELKAQKPRNKCLFRLFEELKSSYDKQQRIHPLVEANREPAAEISRTRAD